MKTLFITLLIFSSYLTHAQEAQLEPADESSQHASFAAFKTHLLKTIRSKNVSELKKVLSKDVSFSFGVNEEKTASEGFSRHYKLADKDSPFWSQLQKTLALGCVGNAENYSCPYLYANWPAEYDSNEHVAVVERNVFVHEKPDISSKKMQPAKYGIFKLLAKQESGNWYAVKLKNGSTGFLAKSKARSATDYRVIFQKIAGEWKIKHFIAGD